MILTWFLSDSAALLIAVNAGMAYPLLKEKKGTEIDKIINMLNQKIDHIVEKIPFLMRLEKQRKGNNNQ